MSSVKTVTIIGDAQTQTRRVGGEFDIRGGGVTVFDDVSQRLLGDAK